jgi:hypothetical protein
LRIEILKVGMNVIPMMYIEDWDRKILDRLGWIISITE